MPAVPSSWARRISQAKEKAEKPKKKASKKTPKKG